MRLLEFIAQYWLQALFGVMLTGLSLLVRRLYQKVEISRKATKDVQEGIKCMLRDRIIQNHEKYMPLGYCPLNVRGNLEEMHAAYKALGGNGAIDHIVRELDGIPTLREEKNK